MYNMCCILVITTTADTKVMFSDDFLFIICIIVDYCSQLEFYDLCFKIHLSGNLEIEWEIARK